MGITNRAKDKGAHKIAAGRDAAQVGRAFVAENSLWFLGLCCGNI